MATNRERFSCEVDSDLLAALRTIADREGRKFEDVLEDAMRDYIEARAQEAPRAYVMAHFRASLNKNRELGKLLAE